MKVFLAKLERFGYTLTCVGQTEEEVRKAMMKEYTRAYKQRNGGLSPRKEYSYWGDQSDYDVAKEEMFVSEMPFGKVEWL